LIAYLIANISAKNIKIRSHVSKLQQAKGGTSFETRCTGLQTVNNGERTFKRHTIWATVELG